LIAILYILATFFCGLCTLFVIHRQTGSSIVYAPIVVALFYVMPFHLLGLMLMLNGTTLVNLDNGFLLLSSCLMTLSIYTILSRSWNGYSLPIVGEYSYPSTWVMLSFLVLLLTHIIVIGSVLSAPPRGFDALWYHLPMAVNWSLSESLLPLIGSYVEFYPGNAELLLFPLIGSVENDSWFSLAQYPWLLLAAAPLWVMSREFGADKQTSLLHSVHF
jgi:hypothetical protein